MASNHAEFGPEERPRRGQRRFPICHFSLDAALPPCDGAFLWCRRDHLILGCLPEAVNPRESATAGESLCGWHDLSSTPFPDDQDDLLRDVRAVERPQAAKLVFLTSRSATRTMILTLLRDSTKRLHEQVEQALDLAARLDNLETYAALLARFHGLYAPIEQHFAANSTYEAVGLDFQQRRKVPFLRDDLAMLGQATEAATAECKHLPDARNLSVGLGMMYVIEGATLGGQVIARAVSSRLGLSVERGCSFFHGYGTQTGAHWRAFCDGLNRCVDARPQLTQGIVQGAAETFICFREWVAC